jgi:DNA (cytosine-5)-methyltransferase 1
MPGEPLAKNGIPNYGDFTKIGPEAGPVDLLVGGTPCQSFSVAGKRLGLDDPRGNLALEYLSLARRLRARWIVWENVPGVLSSYSGSEQAARDVQEGPVGGEGNGIEDRDFAMFLSFVRECGYGFAYRVLDAQYIRVDGLARAVPQRRERVFLVGYLGDWRPAAAVLFEPEGMRRDPAPSRKAGQRVAPTIANRPTGGGGLGTDFDLDGGLIHQAFGGNNTQGPISVATAVNAHGGPAGRIDFESETFVAHALAPAITKNPYGDHESREGLLVAHSLRAEGFDASEDGTGRGTPIVPVIAKTLTRGAESAGKGGYAGRRQEDDDNLVAIPFDTTQITSPVSRSNPKDGDPCHTLSKGMHPPAIVFNPKMGGDPTMGAGVNTDGSSYTLDHSGNSNAVITARAAESPRFESVHGSREDHRPATYGQLVTAGETAPSVNWAVRRLTPRECERLQGFPDDFTNVPYRGKQAADGPRYKALGNSMAVNAMRWIGQRIDIMEAILEAERVAA